MTFSNTIAQWLAAAGIPQVYSSNLNFNSNTPVSLPTANTNFSPIQPRAGYIRIKHALTANQNANVTIGPIYANFSDGNVGNITSGDAAKSANGRWVDESFFFWFDKAIANINVTNITCDNNKTTFDIEFVGIQ